MLSVVGLRLKKIKQSAGQINLPIYQFTGLPITDKRVCRED
jgi:hypothetical protein